MNLRMSHPLDFVLHLWGRHTTMSHNPNYLDFVPLSVAPSHDRESSADDSQKGSAPPLECDLEIGQSISQNWNVDQSVEA